MQGLGDKISSILLDRRYVLLPKKIKKPENCDFVIIKSPSAEEKAFLSFVEKNALESAIDDGVLKELELFELAKSAGLWTEEDAKILANIDSHISFLQNQFDKEKFQAKKNIIKKQITSAKETKEKTLAKSIDFRGKSAEYLAGEIKIYQSIITLTFNKFNEKVWKSEEQFLNDRVEYSDFITFIANEIMSEGYIGEKQIREIARSNEWRIMWILGKDNPSSIFNKKISDFDANQKVLCYWSKVYDSAFEDPNRPSDEIVNDDYEFDLWMANRHLSNEEERKDQKSKIKTSGNHHEYANILDGEYIEVCTCGAEKQKPKGLGERTPHANTCLYGTWKYFSQEEKDAIADQINNRNSPQVKAILNKEQEKISTSGVIEEQTLRDKKSRLKLGAQNNVVSKR